MGCRLNERFDAGSWLSSDVNKSTTMAFCERWGVGKRLVFLDEYRERASHPASAEHCQCCDAHHARGGPADDFPFEGDDQIAHHLGA